MPASCLLGQSLRAPIKPAPTIPTPVCSATLLDGADDPSNTVCVGTPFALLSNLCSPASCLVASQVPQQRAFGSSQHESGSKRVPKLLGEYLRGPCVPSTCLCGHGLAPSSLPCSLPCGWLKPRQLMHLITVVTIVARPPPSFLQLIYGRNEAGGLFGRPRQVCTSSLSSTAVVVKGAVYQQHCSCTCTCVSVHRRGMHASHSPCVHAHQSSHRPTTPAPPCMPPQGSSYVVGNSSTYGMGSRCVCNMFSMRACCTMVARQLLPCSCLAIAACATACAHTTICPHKLCAWAHAAAAPLLGSKGREAGPWSLGLFWLA